MSKTADSRVKFFWIQPIRCLTLTTQRSTMESSHSMYASMGDCSSRRRSNSWYTVTRGRKVRLHTHIKVASLSHTGHVSVTSDLSRADDCGRSAGYFRAAVNLFNLLLSISDALTLPVVGMISGWCVRFVFFECEWSAGSQCCTC